MTSSPSTAVSTSASSTTHFLLDGRDDGFQLFVADRALRTAFSKPRLIFCRSKREFLARHLHR